MARHFETYLAAHTQAVNIEMISPYDIKESAVKMYHDAWVETPDAIDMLGELARMDYTK